MVDSCLAVFGNQESGQFGENDVFKLLLEAVVNDSDNSDLAERLYELCVPSHSHKTFFFLLFE